VDAALDGLGDGELDGLALVLAALGTPLAGQPSERASQMHVGELEESGDCHVVDSLLTYEASRPREAGARPGKPSVAAAGNDRGP
jgi:hypothetical protein